MGASPAEYKSAIRDVEYKSVVRDARDFYLCLSVCICGLMNGARVRGSGGEARKLVSCRVQLGAPRCRLQVGAPRGVGADEGFDGAAARERA